MVELSPSCVNLIQQVIENPYDWDRYLILSDCVEEEGKDELAYTIRWMVKNHRHPQRDKTVSSDSTYCYRWTDSGFRYRYKPAELPVDICKHMMDHYYAWKSYNSWLDAVMDLSSALHIPNRMHHKEAIDR